MSKASSPQTGGQGKRGRLLESAGEVFAEKGFDRATAREICARAGVNTAAVNYYFGGIDGLYAAVVREAHHRLIASDDLAAAVAGKADAAGKLQAFLEKFADVLTGPAAASWPARIIGREVLAPTPGAAEVHEQERLGKLCILKQIVADLLGVPEGDPAVARCCISVMAPCLLLLIVERSNLRSAFPDFALDPPNAAVLARHLVQFALAGMNASATATAQAA
jgi:TetR/AcrR family transcriptional regulator, regulator of cefoperazone and chloramphenicol sensitivity